jgi:transcriptional regulator
VALTDREKAILRPKAQGLSDYKIAQKLKVTAPDITRSRKMVLQKIEQANEDLDFVFRLKNTK